MYTDVLRGIPVILLVFLIGFGVPGLRPVSGRRANPVIWGTVALVLSYSAYVAEVFRAGIDGVHESQRAAAALARADAATRRCAPSCSPRRSAASSRR